MQSFIIIINCSGLYIIVCYTFTSLAGQWVCLHQREHEHVSNASLPAKTSHRLHVTRRQEFFSFLIILWDHCGIWCTPPIINQNTVMWGTTGGGRMALGEGK